MKKILLFASLLFTLTTFAQIPNYVSQTGLVGYWPFTGNANDISGNGNNGTVNGATAAADRYSIINNAYYFSSAGCATYIQASVNTAAIAANKAVSLSFWVYRVGTGCIGPRIMEFGSCAMCPGQILINDGGNNISLRHYLDPTNTVTYTFPNINSNTWYHIVYTNNSTSAKFYLNGTLVSAQTFGTAPLLLGNVAFGRMNHPAYDAFNGNLDDIGLWSRALTACEVKALYDGNLASGFTINPLPDTTLVCDSIQLDAGAGYNSYAWNTGEVSQKITAKQIGWYKVGVTNSNGCMAYDSTYIKSIKADITQKDTTVCKGTLLTLTATVGGIPPSTTTLVENFVMTVSSQFTYTFPTPAGATYYMEVSGQMADHCDNFNAADPAFYINRTPQNNNPYKKWLFDGGFARPDVDVYNASNTYTYTLPVNQTSHTVSFTDNPYTDNCGSITFKVYRVGPPSNVSYKWSTGEITPTIIVTPTQPTTYYVTVTSGVSNCLDSVRINTDILDTSLQVLDTLSFCAGGSVRFHAGVAGHYKWLLNSSPIPGAVNRDYSATQAGIYKVVVTNGNVCSDTSRSEVVTVNARPVAAFGINTVTQCLKNNSFVFTNSSTPNNGTLSYKWDLGDGKTATAKDTTYSYAVASPLRTVQLIAYSDKGCTDTIPKTVTINAAPAKPAITPTGPLAICGNGTVVLTTNATNGIQWYLNGSIIGGAVNQTFTVNTQGSYTVISSLNNCESDSAANVIITTASAIPTPAITPIGATTICGNGTVLLTSDAANGNQWYKDGLQINGATGKNYTANTSGIYTVTASANNCPGISSLPETVLFNPTPVTPIVNAGGPLSVCGIGTVVLSSDAVSGNQWYKDGSIINGEVNQNFTASLSGAYTVISSKNNCPSNASLATIVTISPAAVTPTITANGPLSICGKETVVLSSDALTGNQWYKDSLPIFGATNQNYTPKITGAYMVSVSDACGDHLSKDTRVTINPLTPGIRYPTVHVQIGTAYKLQARTFGNDYLWMPSNGLNRMDTSAPMTSNFSKTQDYIIKITTPAGCITYDSILVKSYNINGILVPTAFSPNGDGLNDRLHLTPINIQHLNYFRIYNRWGQLIYETSNMADSWDGIYKGTIQPVETYIWIAQGIDIYGKLIDQHGQFVIVK